MSNIFKWPGETDGLKLNQFLYVGVDVHKDKHTAVATNCFGHKLLEMEFANTGNDFRQLVASIQNLADQENRQFIFGLEDSFGYGLHLAKYLSDSHLPVKMISPVLVDRARKYETHPEKSDSLDALGVAKVLIQRIDTLPDYSISITDELAKEIKELAMDRDFLVKEQTRIKNQLHRLLHKTYGSEYQKKFKDTFSLKALRYWKKYPTGKVYLLADDSILKNQVRRKIRRLMDIREECKEIENELKTMLDRTGQKLPTMNGCGTVLASAVMAEIRNIERFHSPAALAKYAGLAPRQKSSGKTIRHVKSKSGNRKLNMAIHRIALSQISNSGNQYAKAYFKKKITEGKSKNQALCCLKRKLVNIIYMMLKHKQAYNYQK